MATLVTHSLTPCRLVNLIDVTLVCEDANSKLVEVATVADVELRNVLTMVWCRFGSWSLVIKSFFCPDLEHKVWSQF